MLYLYAIILPEIIEERSFEYLKSVVSEERQKKIDKFMREIDKIRALLAEILLRYILQKHLTIHHNQINFYYNEYGKPSLIGMENLYFNISHSGKWILCGVGNANIGLDVEVFKDNNLDIAKKFYTEEEYRTILIQPKDEQRKLFYRYWTLKESYIKAKGKGLNIPLDSFSFQIKGERITLFVDGQLNTEYSFLVRDLDQSHTMSICWNGAYDELFLTEFQTVDIEQMLQWDFISK